MNRYPISGFSYSEGVSKPRLKGPTIGVRLPLQVDAAVRRKAEADGLSVSVLLADLIARSVGGPVAATPWNERVVPLTRRAAPKVTSRGESNKRTVHPSTDMGCAHRERALIGGGLSRCKDCAKTRGADGVWR